MITFVLFVAGSMNSIASAETTAIQIVKSKATTTAFSKVTLTVEPVDGDLDLDQSTITWFLNDNTNIMNQGVGLKTITVPTDNLSFIVIVRVNTTDAAGVPRYYETTSDIDPILSTSAKSKTDLTVGVSKNEGDSRAKIYLRANPSRPRKFQRVNFTIVNTTKEKLTTNYIKWSVNGKVVEEEPGMEDFAIRMVSSGQETTVKVEVEGKSDFGWSDEMSFIPVDDQRLRLNDTQATRVLRCTAQGLRLIARDMDVLKRRANAFGDVYKESTEKIGTDIKFLEDTWKNLLQEPKDMAKELGKIATNFTTSRPGSLMIIQVADNLIKLGEFILNNDISQRIKYISNEIEYYNRLYKWLDETQYNIQRDIDQMGKRLVSQKKRCEDLAKEEIQPLDEQDVGSTKAFRKYEW